MKNYWKNILGFIILIVLLTLSVYKPNVRTTENYNSLLHSDTTRILTNDRDFIQNLRDYTFLEKEKLQKSKDTVFKKDTVLKMVEGNHKRTIQLIDSVQALKDDTIFALKKEHYQQKSKGLNVFLLIFIVLFAGILGGFARTNYSKLEELETAVVGLRKMVEEKNVQREETHRALEKIGKIQTEMKEIKKEGAGSGDNVLINIIFGVIASSLSFIALTIFNSKLLDFQADIDYFIFWGWCVLGAIFAKNWIKTLYNQVSRKK